MSAQGMLDAVNELEREQRRENKDPLDKEKKPWNGWTKEQESLMAKWSDMAQCYRWLHDRSEKIFHVKMLWINLPVIILSTLGGTANFGIQSLFSDERSQKYASFAIGGISLLAGLLTAIGNYLRFPQLEEAHRVASVTWGKFQRLVAIELALHPNDRMESLDFLKICRAELDRLIEQSPPIPQEALERFDHHFKHLTNLTKPDVCGALEHTTSFESYGLLKEVQQEQKEQKEQEQKKEITAEREPLYRQIQDQVKGEIQLAIQEWTKKEISSSLRGNTLFQGSENKDNEMVIPLHRSDPLIEE